MNRTAASSLIAVAILSCSYSLFGATLGISQDGRFFTIDGSPAFLNGVSYYGAQSITTAGFRTQDLDDMVADGFNWIRVWGFWKTPAGEDVSVLTYAGQVREPYMTKLKTLVAECNSRGMIVDVSLNRDAAGTWVGARTHSQHLACVRTLATELLACRNVYIDVSNERDIADGRFVSLAECGQLITAIKSIDPTRLCTASGNPGSQSQLADFKNVAKTDFIAPHLCRDSGCSAQTLSKVAEYSSWMNNLGWRIPIHLQEPFRRGYSSSYNPVEDDYLRDCNGGKLAGAAGWCFHNGANLNATPPYRCFQMADANGRLYSQIDSVEINVTNGVGPHVGGTDVKTLRFQPEYAEQMARLIGRRDGATVSANVSQDGPGYLTYGPYITRLPADNYQATWRMAIDNVTADNQPVVTIDVYTLDTNAVLATRTITRQEFIQANDFRDFTLNFSYVRPGDRLEWRTYFLDRCHLKVDHIDVVAQQTPTAPVVCEMTPDPDSVTAGVEYTRQLRLCAGYPAPTWTVVQGPTGIQVSSTGRVFGWVPTAAQAGQTFTVNIRAANSKGQDEESWQVAVQPAPVPVFQDQLQDTTRISGQFGSGTFTSAGYMLTHSGGTSANGEPQSRDFVYYNLDGVGHDGTGSIEFDVRGLYANDGVEKNHLLTVADRNGCCDAGVGPCDPAKNGWAVYGSNYYSYIRKVYYQDPSYDNRMKLSAGVLCGAVEEFTPEVYAWDGATTYRFRMTWTGNRMRYYRGLPAEALTLLGDYTLGGAWTPARLHIQVGASSIAQITSDIGGTPGAVYSLIRVYEQDLAGAPTPVASAVAPDICEVRPDPEIARPGVEYVRTLALCGGTTALTWSKSAGPSPARVDATGRVHGWTPAVANVGDTVVFEVEATNAAGSDRERWNVHVLSRADLDQDADVDQTDFGLMQRCLSGSGYAYGDNCGHADLDEDDDVDATDVGRFQSCMGGPNQPCGC